MTFLLDTSVLIEALRKRSTWVKALDDATVAGHQLVTSVVCVAEVLAGVRPAEEQQTHQFLNDLRVYPVTLSVAQRAGQMKNQEAGRGHTLDLADVLIACPAIEHGLVVMTENRKDFEKTNVALWSK